MDVTTPAVPQAWLDTAVLPAHCPVPTSAVSPPVIPAHPASQVGASQDTCGMSCVINKMWLLHQFRFQSQAFFALTYQYFQDAGAQRGRWWATHSSVCHQRSVCVRWRVCATGRASRSKWTVRFVCARQEGHRGVSPTLTAPVSRCSQIHSWRVHTDCCEVWGICFVTLVVHCGWSSWSDWGECLGPCGVQSVQWSFRSPNNPPKHGDGRTCRGIYRKARR